MNGLLRSLRLILSNKRLIDNISLCIKLTMQANSLFLCGTINGEQSIMSKKSKTNQKETHVWRFFSVQVE
jgi:hypothetical protein